MFAALRKTISLESHNSNTRKLLTVGITIRGCQLTSRRSSSCDPVALKQKNSPIKLSSCYHAGRVYVRSGVKKLCTGLLGRHVGTYVRSSMTNTSSASMSTNSLLHVASHGRVQTNRSSWLASPPSRRCYSDDSNHSNSSKSTASNDVGNVNSVQDERIIQVDQLLSHVQVESEAEERPEARRSSEMTIDECVEILREEKACNLVVIGLEGEEAKNYAGYFVTCSGLSTRHLRSMATRLSKEMKGVEVTGVKRVFVEGEDCDDWMVVDMGNIVVHFLLEERRSELELEKLWLLGSDYDDQLRAARNVDDLY